MSGVSYKAEDGTDHVALAHLTIVCDGMYSNLRKNLAEPKVCERGTMGGSVGRCGVGAMDLGHSNLHKKLAEPKMGWVQWSGGGWCWRLCVSELREVWLHSTSPSVVPFPPT